MKRRVTQADVVRYTEGDCGLLAVEIHHVDKTWEVYATADWDHVFCVKEGMALDIEGLRPVSELLAHWDVWDHQREPVAISDYQIGFWFGQKAWFGRYSARRAKQLAPYLVAQAEAGLAA